ncbi:MAG: type IX secretion system membrane protein PorP/SprF [Bacteroidetes bacterium]|nr:MAG: type IX secretion system membrane protein PorP/SprF [Bacteroidota bacterium]
MQTKTKISSGIITLFLAMVSSQFCQAQDPHFSQYFASPLTVNPSFTGKGVENMRVAANVRSQWWGSSISPYNTATLSIEQRIAANRTGDDELAIGALMLTDGSNNNILKNNYFGLSVAYNKGLNADGVNSLGVGLSMNYANRVLDAGKFRFQDQFGSMGFQRSIPSNDFIAIQKNSYVDFNAGVNYSHTKKKWGYTVGVGYFHAGRPVEGVYENNRYQLDTRTTLSFNNWYEVGSNQAKLHINAFTSLQGSTRLYTVGAMYQIPLHGEEALKSVNLGLYHRVGDSFYPYVSLQAQNWLLGLSYDAVTSQVKTAFNSVRSMELSFVIQLPHKKLSNKPNKQIVQW